MIVFNFFKKLIRIKSKTIVIHNCPINERTGDGQYVGRCWCTTYDYVCPRHGNVKSAIIYFGETGKLTNEQ